MKTQRPALPLLLALALFIGIAGCRQAREPQGTVSPALLAQLGTARALYRKANLLEQDGSRAAAITELQKIRAIPFPADSLEGADVIMDANARIALLELASGQADQAMATIDAAIGAAAGPGRARPSYFLANLYTVKGQILEAQADSLATAAGDATAVRARRRAAIEAYDKSIAINQEVGGTLRPPATPPPAPSP